MTAEENAIMVKDKNKGNANVRFVVSIVFTDVKCDRCGRTHSKVISSHFPDREIFD
jgi:hypothetical protein